MTNLIYQWNGSLSRAVINYTISITDRLIFNAKFPEGVRGHPSAEAGQFTPELWKWDVAEIFIAGSDRKYVEVNLSPNDGWWMQGFSAVRQVDEEFSVHEYKVNCEGGQWSCDLSVLQNYLGASSEWMVNVTAILNSPDYEFLSLAKLTGEEADFHQPDSFIPLEKVIVRTLDSERP